MSISDFSTLDMFDSRAIDDRIEELDMLDNADDPEDAAELEALLAFRDGAAASEWEYGVTFISDYYFEDYARELAEDTGAVPDDLAWPRTCIDWEQAARELQSDYASVEFDGLTFYFRD